MKRKRGIFPVICFFLLFPISATAEPNQPTVKMLHIFVSVNKNKVSFENIWVFERQQAGFPWEVNIDLPAGATALSVDEPDKTEFLKQSGAVRKKMSSDSTIDTVGFSYIMQGDGDLCKTLIKSRYGVGSMVVFLSGPAVRLSSNVLKLDESLTKGFGYVGTYTTCDLPAGAKIEINLENLPAATGRLFETVCLVGFLFMVVIALIILRRSRGADRRSISGETCSK